MVTGGRTGAFFSLPPPSQACAPTVGPPLLVAESEEPPRALSRPLSLLPYPGSSAPHPTSSLPPRRPTSPRPAPCLLSEPFLLSQGPGVWGALSCCWWESQGAERLSLVCLLGWP